MPNASRGYESPDLIVNAIGRKELITYFRHRLSDPALSLSRPEMVLAFAKLAREDGLDLLLRIAQSKSEVIQIPAIRAIGDILKDLPVNSLNRSSVQGVFRELAKHPSLATRSACAIALIEGGEVRAVTEFFGDGLTNLTADAQAEMVKAGVQVKRPRRKRQRMPGNKGLHSMIGNVRRQELDTLRQILKRSSIVMITGAPGTGKTSLAAQFAQESGYQAAIWITAPASEQQMLTAIANRLHIVVPPASSTKVSEALKAIRPLVVVDDFDDCAPVLFSSIKDLAASSSAHFILVSRRADAAPVPVVSLSAFSYRESEAFCRAALDPSSLSKEYTRKLFESTRGNPLLLRLILDGLRESGTQGSFDDKLNELSFSVREVLGAEVRRLKPDERRAMEMLARCETGVALTREFLCVFGTAELMYDSAEETRDVFKRLITRCLARESEGVVSIAHPFLKDVVRQLTDSRTAARLDRRFDAFVSSSGGTDGV